MALAHHQLLAQSLERVQQKARRGIIRSQDIMRLDRERLISDGWLTPVIRGWYLLKQPQSSHGESTQWYSSYWDFISVYLESRFKNNYCLSAPASMMLHLGATTIPKQLLIMVKTGGSSIIDLLLSTSIIIYQETKSFPKITEQINEINVMPLPTALHRISPNFFQAEPSEAELALKLVDPTALSRELLSGNNIASANRIIGAYLFLNELQRASQLQSALKAAGYQVVPTNPFMIKQAFLLNQSRIRSPYEGRITMMWQQMREIVLSIFPNEPGQPEKFNNYLIQLEKIYINDAYNSLSIEGYEVSPELIKRIAEGQWDPGNFQYDRNQINAMAAKGYREAFNAVKNSIRNIFQHQNPGLVIKNDLHSWYSALFSPSIKAGLLAAEQLAGYRTHQVYIKGSKHTPLPKDALIDAMEAFFNCLINEPSAAVRGILGHFIFVFIHPYMDGNGRIGRFLMNTAFSSGGFPWTIVRVTHRESYMRSLEKASVEQDIKPFTEFILEEMRQNWD